MSSREWKPGDVAMIQVPTSSTPRGDVNESGWSWIRAARQDSGWADLTDSDYFWRDEYVHFGSEPRPLAVIDPEDREQVERLGSLVEANGVVHFGVMRTDALQAALREFTNPTPLKPEEPTGLGAVVKDAEGLTWVRVDGEYRHPWFTPTENNVRQYVDINAVRVLSEGWSA